jgi:hypothetical protein
VASSSTVASAHGSVPVTHHGMYAPTTETHDRNGRTVFGLSRWPVDVVGCNEPSPCVDRTRRCKRCKGCGPRLHFRRPRSGPRRRPMSRRDVSLAAATATATKVKSPTKRCSEVLLKTTAPAKSVQEDTYIYKHNSSKKQTICTLERSTFS